MPPQKDASHEEIWDDSMLVDSWNDALEEYRRYHSIHARGEKAEDVLKAFEESTEVEAEPEYIENEAKHTEPNGTPSKEAGPEGPSTHATISAENKHFHKTEEQPTTEEQSGTPREGRKPDVQALPQHLVGQVQDEGLKNLLMSWYYAGYYTGLYEGQQQGRSGKQPGPSA
ncbi:hypothetical protein F5884DRAFT_745521 [Xylogone sp. PMI_703]|nr:hypothetical protein F5884DRAFT_745521 [Xylogone sp. PMI_703]